MKTTTLWACLLMIVSLSYASSAHKVRAGENDHTIAQKYGVTVKQLHEANGGVNWKGLQIGQSLKVPGQDKSNSKNSKTPKTQSKSSVSAPKPNSSHVVATGDSDWTIARKYNLTVAQLKAMNPGLSFEPLKLGAKVKVYKTPVKVAKVTPKAKPAPKTVAKVAPKPAQKPVAKAQLKVTLASAPPTKSTVPTVKPVIKPVAGTITTMNAAIAGTDVALRSSGSSSAGKIITLQPGVIGRVVDHQGEWYRLMFAGGTTGWVKGTLLKNSEKAITALPTTKRAPERSPRNVASLGGSQTSAGKDLIATALAQQGVRYVWGGTSRGGFDCSGFVQYVFRSHGITLPRTSREQSTRGVPVAKSNLRAGDCLFFVTRGSSVSHVGIYIGNNRFVHASSGGGRVRINVLSEGYYAKRFVGARRMSDKFVSNAFQQDFDRWADTLPVEQVPDNIDPEPETVVGDNRGTDTVAP